MDVREATRTTTDQKTVFGLNNRHKALPCNKNDAYRLNRMPRAILKSVEIRKAIIVTREIMPRSASQLCKDKARLSRFSIHDYWIMHEGLYASCIINELALKHNPFCYTGNASSVLSLQKHCSFARFVTAINCTIFRL